jgi:hypothetical protein
MIEVFVRIDHPLLLQKQEVNSLKEGCTTTVVFHKNHAINK